MAGVECSGVWRTGLVRHDSLEFGYDENRQLAQRPFDT
jgi:hypothetical protein